MRRGGTSGLVNSMHGHKVELRPPQGRLLRAQSDEACVSLLPPLPPLLTVHLTPALALVVQLRCLSINGHRRDFLGFRPVAGHRPITRFKVSRKRNGFKSPNIFSLCRSCGMNCPTVIFA